MPLSSAHRTPDEPLTMARATERAFLQDMFLAATFLAAYPAPSFAVLPQRLSLAGAAGASQSKPSIVVASTVAVRLMSATYASLRVARNWHRRVLSRGVMRLDPHVARLRAGRAPE